MNKCKVLPLGFHLLLSICGHQRNPQNSWPGLGVGKECKQCKTAERWKRGWCTLGAWGKVLRTQRGAEGSSATWVPAEQKRGFPTPLMSCWGLRRSNSTWAKSSCCEWGKELLLKTCCEPWSEWLLSVRAPLLLSLSLCGSFSLSLSLQIYSKCILSVMIERMP